MRCERAQELFSDYCEGTIQPAFAVSLESHLSSCPHCRTEVESIRQLWQMLDEVPLVDPPAGFRAHVLNRLEESLASAAPKPAFDLRSLFTRRTAAWTTAAVLVLLFGTVAIPGRYTSAWMGSLSELFHRSQPALTVSVGDVQAPNSLSSEMTVNLSVAGSGESQASVRVLSGGAVLTDDSRAVSLSPGKSAELHLKRLGPLTNEPIRLELSWKDGGTDRLETFTVR